MNRLLFVILLLCGALQSSAQYTRPIGRIRSEERHRRVMIGAGVANTYDTYLSPLEYRGPQLSLMREALRMTHWRHMSTQGIFQLSGTYTHNKAENAKAMGGQLSYRQSWHYVWPMGTHWHLGAGGGCGALAGFLYHIRNAGNNPAQAQADLWLHASLGARYNYKILAVRAQLEAPFMGMMFAPHYGESYYEMFSIEQASGAGIVFTHPGNYPTLRCMLTVDIRIQNGTICAGYGADLLQATPNLLRRHTYLHTGYIGYSRRFKLLH